MPHLVGAPIVVAFPREVRVVVEPSPEELQEPLARILGRRKIRFSYSHVGFPRARNCARPKAYARGKCANNALSRQVRIEDALLHLFSCLCQNGRKILRINGFACASQLCEMPPLVKCHHFAFFRGLILIRDL
jgi:hypothetical protein